MKTNVVMLVIDSLSYWYIEEYKKFNKNSFFHELEKKTFNATQMYSTGPFTEAALMGLLASQYPLDNQSYQVLLHDANKILLKTFQENGYEVYMGGQMPYLCDFNANVWEYRDSDKKSFDSFVSLIFWKYRFKHFFEWYDKGLIKEQEKELLIDILTFIFDYSKEENNVEKENEYNCFIQDKKQYINDFLKLKKEHTFYKCFLNTDRIEWETKETSKITDKLVEKLPNSCEAELLCEIGLKNQKKYIDYNRDFCEADEECKRILDRDLAGWNNRDIQSNNNLIRHFRGINFIPSRPTLGRELDSLLNWMDTREKEIPFFSYLHVFDFHYRECLTEDDDRDYLEKMDEIGGMLKNLSDMKMSVSKVLSLMHIEKQLRKFWEQLEKRDFFKDSDIIITADHGITNFMYPITAAKSERWVYNKILFNVPFYMAGSEVENGTSDEILESLDIPVSILSHVGIPVPNEYQGKNFLTGESIRSFSHTEWINECPNIIRRPIRFGLRDKKYNITYIASLNEFFDSGECIAIFDYEEDPDGIVNLAFGSRKEEILEQYLPLIRQRWFELLKHYYLDYEGKYFDKIRTFRMLKENPEQIIKWSEEQRDFSWEKFKRDAEGKKIILFGTSGYAKECLEGLNLCIYEIWDNDVAKDNTYFMGHIVKKPYELLHSADDYVFIIADQYEIETKIQLQDMNLKTVYIGRQILKKKALERRV